MWSILSILLFISYISGQSLHLQGSNSTAVLGKTFQFTCSVDGGGPPQGLLYFNRQTALTVCIVKTDNCSTFSHTSGYLCDCVNGQTAVFYNNIASVSLKDSDDNWVCQYNGISSNTVKLDVLYPPTINSVPNSINLTENTSPGIDCSSNITEGNPKTTSYTWQGPNGYNRTGPILDRTMNRTTTGQYICTATNTAGLSDEAEIHINALFPPTITSVPSKLNLTENTSPGIDCSSNIKEGYPSVTSYNWKDPGGSLVTGPVLDKNISRSQGGQYTCTATNTAGLSDKADMAIDVMYPPAITSVPRNINLTVNTSTNIDCSSNITPGNPASTSFTWQGPDGYNVSGPVLNRLMNKTDGGQYNCTATNTAGLSDKAEINIDVLYPPIITSVPKMFNMTENTSPKIDCSANIIQGNPNSTSYTWQGPDGYNVAEPILDTVINRTEGGVYTCIATNTAKLSDEAEMTIDVMYPPRITSVPKNLNLTENSSPTIDCSSNITEGNPTTTSYTWQGPDGYSSSGSVLDRIMNRTEAGQYTCTAINTAGLSDKADMRIDILYPPIITSVPKKFNMTENTSPKIDCSANIIQGNPNSTSYTWQGPDGYNVAEPILDTVINRTEGGVYTCTATNTAKLSDEAEMTIDVMYPPRITSVPQNLNLTENSSLTIDCSGNITEGNPTTTSYTWQGPDGYSSSGSVLDRIMNRTEAGQYICTATNTAGLSDTADMQIDILYPPIITSVPNKLNLTENTSTKVDCSADIIQGNPNSTSYTWQGPDGYNMTGPKLERVINRTEGGVYTCTATNTAKLSDKAEITIDVMYPPRITSVPKNLNVTENSSPRIDCNSNIIQGNPNTTSYTWQGPDGYSSSGSVLDRVMNRTEAGQYTCTATNTAGLSDKAETHIDVLYPPGITSVPKKLNLTENTSPEIDCSSNIIPGNPSSTSYSWQGPDGYISEESVLDRVMNRTEAGQYTCTVTNTADLSNKAGMAIDVLYPPLITTVPSNISVPKNTSPDIDCSSDLEQGNPTATSYMWLGPDGYSLTAAVLDRILNRTDGGEYTCIATNTAGLSDEANVTIHVLHNNKQEGDELSLKLGLGLGAGVFIVLIVIMVVVCRKRRQNYIRVHNAHAGQNYLIVGYGALANAVQHSPDAPNQE